MYQSNDQYYPRFYQYTTHSVEIFKTSCSKDMFTVRDGGGDSFGVFTDLHIQVRNFVLSSLDGKFELQSQILERNK